MVSGHPAPARWRALALAAVSPLLLASCSTASPESSSASPGAEPNGQLTVYAAASLSGPFTELAQEFEAEHSGITVRLNFAGSADLVSQIQTGAPADVFASADQANMDKVVSGGLADGEPAAFASNILTIAVPPGNPAGITRFQDLGDPGLQVVMCAEQVPCGAAAAGVEAATGTVISPVSEESSVSGVLGKVTSGEADAGLVYVTDVRAAAGKVEEVPFPEAGKAVNIYPIVGLSGSPQAPLADEFIRFIRGSDGSGVLRKAGFGEP